MVAGSLKWGQYFRAVAPPVVYGMLAGIGVLTHASLTQASPFAHEVAFSPPSQLTSLAHAFTSGSWLLSPDLELPPPRERGMFAFHISVLSDSWFCPVQRPSDSLGPTVVECTTHRGIHGRLPSTVG